MKDPYLKLAKETTETYIRNKKKVKTPQNLPSKMLENRGGVFVSLHRKNDQSLRGCIGTFAPTQDNVAQEIINNAIAATQDPRFERVRPEELDNLTYKVDVLSPVKKAKLEDLDPKKYGLLVEAFGNRKGLLLPDLPGIETAQQQLEFCRKKGGIAAWEKVKLYTFTVERHEEK